ncbi:MAG: hypothetical protein AAGD38_24700, partial [Acidobacteriota bacterium]
MRTPATLLTITLALMLSTTACHTAPDETTLGTVAASSPTSDAPTASTGSATIATYLHVSDVHLDLSGESSDTDP